MLSAGFILQGRYQIIRELGSGGFATVYLAEDTRLNGRPVAIKEFNAAKLPPADQGWARRSFQNEAQVLSRLSHESIAAVTDFFSSGGLDYMVMEYVPGETLAQAWQRVGGRIHHDQVLIWAQTLCRVLDYLHRQNPPIIFRDLKPDNIMVQPDGRLKIIDFGIARLFKPGQTQDTRALGTPGYASPEQYGQKQTDARSDVYSLAAVLHQLLSGHDPALTPMNFPDLLALNPYVPPRIAAAIHQALNPNPAQRYPQAQDFAAALGAPITSPIIGPVPTPPPHDARAWLRPVLGALLVLSLALGAWGLWSNQTTGGNGPTVFVSTQVATVMATATETFLGRETLTSTPVSALTATRTPEPTPTTTAVATHAPTATNTATATAPPTATTMPPSGPPTGRIVFTCFIDGIDQICAMDADGGNQQQLTFSQATNFYASWAPDGRQIIFSSRREGSFELYLMNSDGSNQRRISQNLGSLFSPAISPDGRFILFTSARGNSQNIWVMNMDGANARALTNTSGNNLDPVWSPDGSQIAFSSDRDGDAAHYVMNADGSNVRRLTTDIADIGGRSDWSPDGRWLAFYAGSRENRQIYLVAVDGFEVRRLTDASSNLAPSFSPDGQWIAFTSYRDGDAEVFIMRPDGTEVTQLTFNSRPDWQPRWSP
jgi:WD40 repeat protein/tRNA A-37 threonylcarbamoyl transferase component Bud32